MYLQRLRDLREDRDLTQKQVAEILGIQQTVYSRYERGFQNIPLEFLIKLSNFYAVSTDYLLGNSKYSINEPPNNQEIELLRCYRQLPSDDKELLLEQARLYLRHARKKPKSDSHSA